MTDEFKNQLQKKMGNLSIVLSEVQAVQFYQYYELLSKWNRVMNLTTVTEPSEVITKHFVDSLSLVNLIKDFDKTKEYCLIDVGTGAGFPGIPLKIVFPNLTMTLLDSLNKRVKFLNEVIKQLGLTSIQAVHGRAEDLGRDNMNREQYDIAVSRAVANLSTLSEYCMPFVRLGGIFVSYKSVKVEEELQTAKHAVFLLGGKITCIERFLLPGTDAERVLVRIDKVARCSEQYPRKAGTPAKNPLN